MIGHEGEGMQNDVVGATALEERGDEQSIIAIVKKDLLFIIAAIHGMVKQAGFIDAQGTGHRELLSDLKKRKRAMAG